MNVRRFVKIGRPGYKGQKVYVCVCVSVVCVLCVDVVYV